MADSPATNTNGGLAINFDGGINDTTAWRTRIYMTGQDTIKADETNYKSVVIYSAADVGKISCSLRADITLDVVGNNINTTAISRFSGKTLSGIFFTQATKTGDIALTVFRDNGSISSATWYVECQKF